MTRLPEPPFELGAFLVVELVRVGGMGAVYRAVDQRLGRTVAIKRSVTPPREDVERARQIHGEATALARVNHPCLLQLHDVLDTEEQRWLVLEWVEGLTVADWLEHAEPSAARALGVATEVAGGLAAIHDAGLVHRDLTAENVMVTSSGGVKLVDFGLARELSVDPNASTGIQGTPRAMAPELLRGQAATPRSDLFSLGVLIYEMLAGCSPFAAPGAVETMARASHEPHVALIDRVPAVPSEGSVLVDRLLAKDPDDRPDSAADVARALRALGTPHRSGRPAGPVDGPSETEPLPIDPPSTEASPDMSSALLTERRQVTILSCRLVGVDGSLAALDPEALFQVLPVFRQRVNDIVDTWGGHLTHLQGHHLVLLFGYPAAEEESGEAAAEAAWELVRSFDHDRSSAPAADIAARAGLHTGYILLGPRQRLVQGHVLDTAARLEASARPGEILVSETTLPLVLSAFETTSTLDPSTGRSTGRLVDRRPPDAWDDRDTGPAPRPVGESLIGRHRELRWLEERWIATTGGAGHTVLVTGERGIGKTALLAMLRGRMEPADAHWLWVRAGRRRRLAESAIVWPILEQLLSSSSRLDVQQARTKGFWIDAMEHWLPSSSSAVQSSLGRLADRLARIDAAPPTTSDPLSELDHEVCMGLLAEAAHQRPLVLVVDGLQWLDSSSLSWLTTLHRAIASIPLLMLWTMRQDARPDWTPPIGVSRLPIGRLDDRQSRRLVAAWRSEVADAEGADPPWLGLAAGNPGHLGAFCRAETRPTERGIADTGQWLPPSVWNAYAEQLDQLGGARQVVRVASVLGMESTLDQLEGLLPSELAEWLRQDLEALVDAGVFERPDARRVRFCDPLMRAVAMASLAFDTTRRLSESDGV